MTDQEAREYGPEGYAKIMELRRQNEEQLPQGVLH
jgi:hypothetical protein